MIISIEGNIGTGKSTIIELLRDIFSHRTDIAFISEPVNEWQTLIDNDDNQNILEKFYRDPKRWSYSFQMNAFITRAKQILTSKKEIIIMERSILTDSKIFAAILREEGSISDIEWKLHANWFEWLKDSFRIVPDHYIYLKADPEVSHSRMCSRNRNEEATVPLDYLRKISIKHDKWLENTDHCKIINANEICDSYIQSVRSHIETIV